MTTNNIWQQPAINFEAGKCIATTKMYDNNFGARKIEVQLSNFGHCMAD